MDSSRETTVKLSRKIDLRTVYTEEYFWRLILPSIHTCYTSSILLCIMKEKPTCLIFCFFSHSCRGGFIQISLN